jgi:uncharacterized protein YeaO (DUF488 family)
VKPTFRVQRIYDDDGDLHSYRVLVDRLWPRGLTKGRAALDAWSKDVAPSTELRRWYGHDVARFDEFSQRYADELRSPPAADAVAELRRIGGVRAVVLFTATRDVEHSGAIVLLEHLLEQHRR